MEAQVSKTFSKVMSFLGAVLMTILAGIFGMLALSFLFISIIEGDLLFGVAATAASAFLAALCWSLRREV